MEKALELLLENFQTSIDTLGTRMEAMAEGMYERLDKIDDKQATANGRTGTNEGDIKALRTLITPTLQITESRSAHSAAEVVALAQWVRNLQGIPAMAWVALIAVLVLASLQANLPAVAERIGEKYIDRKYPQQNIEKPK